MTFIDSNVPMYLVGSQHPNRSRATGLLEGLASERTRLVSDAEVMQEILHRYRAIQRLDAIQPAFDALLTIADEIIPIDRRDVERAKDILLGRWQLSARDAIHVAVMERHDITKILSFDSGFDTVPGIERIH